MKLAVTIEIDVDRDAWDREYGLNHATNGHFAADVMTYVRETVEHGSYAFGEGQIGIVLGAKVVQRRD